ncbi:MAG: acyl-CoA thioesterase [Gammaproteobacteria bacterium]|nr:acyl-CoA thioesterase [Gammaproteobacteria bacterium]MBT8444796.1 acyl-CoA thioesterase [Gammaproteobacteria bacterium]NND37789.1 acyl-CoA thioesterase [Gammaproteobacteria bacterium]
MNHRKLVLPEHMNSQDSLFGGYLLKWLDEFAYITAQLEFPGRRFVTIAMNNVEFRHPITCGQILRFQVTRGRLGTTSVEYEVEVFDDRTGDRDLVLFATQITFVNLDDDGRKAPISGDGA